MLTEQVQEEITKQVSTLSGTALANALSRRDGGSAPIVIRIRFAGMDEDEIPVVEDRNLVFLRRLVTALTATMIVGVLTVVVLLVIRLQTPAPPSLPDEVSLPDGVTARAVTFGQGWVGVVTDDDRFLVLDAETGEMLDAVEITLPQ